MTQYDKTIKEPAVCRLIDSFITRLGDAASWLYTLLVINIVVQVILRYALGEGKIWLEELEWHLYGICIMLGLSYCLTANAHIRLDIFYRNFSLLKQEVIELSGMLIFVLPLFVILFFHGLDFLKHAWHVNESSPHPLGLPYWWIIKSVIPISMFLMIMAALSRAVRSLAVIFQLFKQKG